MRVLLAGFALVALLVGLQTTPVPEESTLDLRLSRDFGYSSGSGRIQGTFSMRVTGPVDLVRVVFFIDGASIGELAEAPYRLRFQTSEYSLGVHTLTATGFTISGGELKSNQVRVEFVSAEAGWQEAGKIVLPILGLAFGAIMLSFVFTFVTGRKLKELPLGTSRKYGPAGGAICARCNRPFSRNIFAPNLLIGKFDRCPYCGKWGVVHAQPLAVLQAAETAELADAHAGGQAPTESDEQKLKKEIEASRFQDL